MTTTSNDIYVSQQGTEYYNGTGVFTGVDAGTATNVLTSNGTGMAPSFQAMPGSTFAPNATIELFDDFISCDPVGIDATINRSRLFWYNYGGGFSLDYTNITSSNPGMIIAPALDFPGVTPQVLLSFQSARPVIGTGNFLLGGGAITMNFVFTILAFTSTYTFQCGMGDLTSYITGDPDSGVYIQFTANGGLSGSWFAKTSSTGTISSVFPAFKPTLGFHNVMIMINAAATSVEYFIDGVSIGTITTNIPTTLISPFFCIQGSTVAGVVSMDLFYMKQTLTTPR